MKKRTIATLLIILGIVTLSFKIEKVDAAKPPKFSGVQSRGIHNMKYYIHSSAGFGDISNAVGNWMYTGWSNPLYIYKQGNNTGTAIDFYGGSLRDGLGG